MESCFILSLDPPYKVILPTKKFHGQSILSSLTIAKLVETQQLVNIFITRRRLFAKALPFKKTLIYKT